MAAAPSSRRPRFGSNAKRYREPPPAAPRMALPRATASNHAGFNGKIRKEEEEKKERKKKRKKKIVLGAKKLRQTIEMGTPQDRAPTPYENDKALHFLQASYKEYDEMIDIMQVSESHDEVLHKNFVFQPPGKSVGLEVNARSCKVRKPTQRRRGKRDGKKAAEKSEEKAPAAQGAQGGKGKKEAKPARNDKPYGQQDQTCYKCGIWGPLELYLRGALARRRRILGQQECQGVRRGTHG
ncbi:hypothetical protein OsI_12052 [Oryza sativa Indica Group]|uniref:Uncharacterized protein n=1 Tax=Oryza sativa subsp. indica TaxID=39946 RepID=B8AJS9_ORYSI|nr:hypothetical protein OsI_12052 [Oryza sativa Indica Group]